MGIIDKTIIKKWILPHLTIGTRGFETSVPMVEIVDCIFHRLKTGCHWGARRWRELPTKQFFSGRALQWNSVFYYYNKWRQPLLCKAGCWKIVWINLLSKNPQCLDLSSVQFDGIHTPAKNGDDAVGYQGRKA